jgi:hypothetical protein
MLSVPNQCKPGCANQVFPEIRETRASRLRSFARVGTTAPAPDRWQRRLRNLVLNRSPQRQIPFTNARTGWWRHWLYRQRQIHVHSHYNLCIKSAFTRIS